MTTRDPVMVDPVDDTNMGVTYSSTGNKQIDDIVSFIKKSFPDIDLAGNGMSAEERAAAWARELESGTGRSYEELRADIFNFVVGEDRVKQWVSDAFASRGLTVATRDESEEERLARITGQLITGERTFFELGQTLDEFAPVQPGGATDPAGPTEPVAPPGIMGGGNIVKINRGGGSDPLWGMIYVVGGIEHIYTFNSKEDLVATLGANFADRYGVQSIQESSVNDGNTWILGDADSLVGQTGQNYGQFFSNAMEEAALEAGVRNPGLIGQYLSDPEVQRILAMGAAGDWEPARVQAELRQTNVYRNVLYPGIDSILKSGVAGDNPESYYMNYMSSVEGSLAALGYEKDADGSYRSHVADLLTANIRADDFNMFAPTFVRATQSADYAAVLDQWTQRDLGVALDFDNWFDVLEGNAAPEIADVVEKATLQFQADLAATTLSPDQISRLAELTQMSEQQMTVAFSNAEEALLSVGDEDLARYGLSQQQLVNAAFGVDTDGVSATQINRQARKAAQELGIQDDQKSGFFLGFDRMSRPVRQGLNAIRPETG